MKPLENTSNYEVKLKSLEKNENKKYSSWLSKIKMSGKSSAEFQWTDDDIQLPLEGTQNLKDEKDYKGLNWELALGLTHSHT